MSEEKTKEKPEEAEQENQEAPPEEQKEEDEDMTKETPEEAEEVEEVKDEEQLAKEKKTVQNIEGWKPRTQIGKKVKLGEIKDIDAILDTGHHILEAEIVDALFPTIESDLLLIGQSKGKFGGGQRRIFKQTQKKTKEGNKPNFATLAVVGNKDGYVGIGYGKAKETVPSREKGVRRAKLNIMKIRRGCGSWECSCGNPHSIPFSVTGKCSSVEITLYPASKGTGLCIEPECAKILRLAGIKDIWSKTRGHTKTKINLLAACIDALQKLNRTKVLPKHREMLSIREGRLE